MIPSAPTAGSSMISGSKEITFSWQPPITSDSVPVTNYMIVITPTGGIAREYIVDAPNTYYRATELEKDVSIQAIVKASYDNGISYGPEFSFSPVTPIIAHSVAPASASASVVSPGLVEIVWTASSIEPQGVAYYRIMSQSLNPTDPTIGFITKDLSDTSCQIDGLNPSSEYTFTVCIVNAAGESPAVTTNSIHFE